MSLTRTAYTPTVVNESSSNTVTTGTHTFPNGELVVVLFDAQSNGNNLNPVSQFSIDDTVADLTWSTPAASDSGTGDYGTATIAFTAIGNGTPCTLTITSGSASFHNCRVQPYSYSGQHATPIGATFAETGGPTDGAWTPNLSAAPAASSEVIGTIAGALNSGAPTVTAGTGCTELYDAAHTDWYVAQGQVRTGSTSQAFGWDDVIVGGGGYYRPPCAVAIEIVAAATGASITGTGALTIPGTVAVAGTGVAGHTGTGTPTITQATVAGTGTLAGRWISHGATVEADNASVTPTFGSTALANDIALALGFQRTGTTGRTLSCSGYTTIDSYGASAQQPMYMFGKIAGAGEANPTIVPAGGAAGDIVQGVAVLLRDMRLDLATIRHAFIHDNTLNATTGTPINTPALTITQAGCVVIMMVTYGGTATFGSFDPGAAGWIQKVFTSTTLGNDQTIAVYVLEQTTAANIPSSTITCTSGAGATARVDMVALRTDNVADVTGTGALSIVQSTIAGAGASGHEGTGTAVITQATAAGTGTTSGVPQDLTGSGSSAIDNTTTAGAGARGSNDLPGDINIVLPGFAIDGSGGVTSGAAITGTGTITLANVTVLGTVLGGHPGDGALTLPAATLAGTGALGHVGTGALALNGPLVNGTNIPRATSGRGVSIRIGLGF